jgi:hypothetical protein
MGIYRINALCFKSLKKFRITQKQQAPADAPVVGRPKMKNEEV